MFSSFWVSIPLSETEIDHVYYILLFAMTNQEVIGLHVSVNKMIVVEELEALYHLIGQHHGRLNGEFSFAVVEQILQAGAQKVHNHRIVVAFNSEPVDRRDTS